VFTNLAGQKRITKMLSTSLKRTRQTKKTKEKRPQFVEKKMGGEKNGAARLVRIKKLRNYYPTAEKRVKKTRNPGRQLFKNHKRTLRKSLTPGTVCILVAGPHRGKRVVFLKQLSSGLLLVTGPFRINGCPLRRINKIYVIATKTKIDLKGIKVPSHLYNDDYYRRKRIEKRPKRRGGDGDIFTKTKEPYKASEERKNDQKIVDDQLIKALKENHGSEKKLICGYLGSTFSLRNGQYPHRLNF